MAGGSTDAGVGAGAGVAASSVGDAVVGATTRASLDVAGGVSVGSLLVASPGDASTGALAAPVGVVLDASTGDASTGALAGDGSTGALKGALIGIGAL